MSLYLVRIEDEGDRPDETCDWIARALAVGFHAEVAVKAWYPCQWPGESQRPGDEGSFPWHRFNSAGNPIVPEPEEVDQDG